MPGSGNKMRLLKAVGAMLLGAATATVHASSPPPLPLALARRQAATPFQVDDFWVQVLPRQLQGQWWYWVSANITLQPGQGSTWCYGWQATGSGSAAAIAQGIPPTACTMGPTGLAWSFDVSADGGGYGYGDGYGAPGYAYTVYYNGSSAAGPVSLRGEHDVGAHDISTAVDEGVLVAYYVGPRSFSVPVSSLG